MMLHIKYQGSWTYGFRKEDVSCFPYIRGTPAVLGTWRNCYLFSEICGALVIILGEVGTKLIVLGIYGALPKAKND